MEGLDDQGFERFGDRGLCEVEVEGMEVREIRRWCVCGLLRVLEPPQGAGSRFSVWVLEGRFLGQSGEFQQSDRRGDGSDVLSCKLAICIGMHDVGVVETSSKCRRGPLLCDRVCMSFRDRDSKGKGNTIKIEVVLVETRNLDDLEI